MAVRIAGKRHALIAGPQRAGRPWRHPMRRILLALGISAAIAAGIAPAAMAATTAVQSTPVAAAGSGPGVMYHG